MLDLSLIKVGPASQTVGKHGLNVSRCENTLCLYLTVVDGLNMLNPFKPEFTIVIFVHYKPRIAVAILDLQWMKMI